MREGEQESEREREDRKGLARATEIKRDSITLMKIIRPMSLVFPLTLLSRKIWKQRSSS